MYWCHVLSAGEDTGSGVMAVKLLVSVFVVETKTLNCSFPNWRSQDFPQKLNSSVPDVICIFGEIIQSLLDGAVVENATIIFFPVLAVQFEFSVGSIGGVVAVELNT